MKNQKKVAILVAMLFAAVCFSASEARADHRHGRATFGLTLPNLGVYVGNGGVSVGTGGIYFDTRSYNRSPYQYRSYPGRGYPGYGYPGYSNPYVNPYYGRRPTQYVPPVTTYPRPCDNYDYGQYQRQQQDYRRQQEELRRAQERYQRDLERIQRQYGYRR